jgi:hypothetical protein
MQAAMNCQKVKALLLQAKATKAAAAAAAGTAGLGGVYGSETLGSEHHVGAHVCWLLTNRLGASSFQLYSGIYAVSTLLYMH